ncbi:MAG: hypothetical protein ABIJ34_05110 [archaeon]
MMTDLIEKLIERRDKLDSQFSVKDLSEDKKNHLKGAISEIDNILMLLGEFPSQDLTKEEAEDFFLMKPVYEKSFLDSIKNFMKGII